VQKVSRLTLSILSSERLYYVILGLLIFQALWFAFSAVYPMAFDENFHFGLIKIYASQWSPFFTSVPPDSGAFGPLTRDSSYLYHYLMSFPYRALTLFISSQEMQVILLRLLNIGFFVGGVMLFRKLLFKTPASRALVHFALLMFVLIPITPMLAAHINYDNLIFLLTPIILLLALRCTQTLQTTYTLPIVPFITFVIVCLFTSITKYAFLPIFFAIFLYLIYVWFRIPKDNRFTFLKRLWPYFHNLSLKLQFLLIGLLLLSAGLFIERHGGNLLQYHSLVPECSQVVNAEHCSQYGPWQRDELMKQRLTEAPQPNPIEFIAGWFGGMMFRLFFAINFDYDTRFPLLVPFITAFTIAIVGIILSAIYIRRLIQRNQTILLFSLVIAIYTISIMATNFKSYAEVGELVAVNGRYFIPLLLPIFIIVGMAYRELLQKARNALRAKAILSLVVFLLFLQGGGLLTFLIRSEQNWYWQDSTIIALNQAAQSIGEFFVIIKLSF
jgi:hypothetical protein